MLRADWGFDGFVVSDWGAVVDPVAADAAGLDLEILHSSNSWEPWKRRRSRQSLTPEPHTA